MTLIPQTINTIKKTPNDLIIKIKEAVSKNELMLIINDIDLTISTGGSNGELDPRNTYYNDASAQALAEIEKKGHILGFITNRSGQQVVRMNKKAGINKSIIVGTYGYELFKSDLNHPTSGESFIDESIEIYRPEISHILTALRENLFRRLKLSKDIFEETEVEIKTLHGSIILERKGVNSDYPEGLAAVYNFNLVESGVRSEIAAGMLSDYENMFKLLISENYRLGLMLKHIWGHLPAEESPEKPGKFSLRFEPLNKKSKIIGMRKIFAEVKNLLPENQHIGTIIMAGDSDEDFEAVIEAKHLVNGQYSNGFKKPQVYGIWVKPPEYQELASHTADFYVNGIDEYSGFLTDLAAIL